MPYADPEKRKEFNREYWQKTREQQLAKKKENAGRARETHRAWRKRNLEKRAADMRRFREDPKNRVASNLRSRISNVLQGRRKFFSLGEVIGCSLDELKAWLEGWFEPGMSWENYGDWEIDHSRPCASFDLLEPDQQRKCFHYLNLRTLWKAENRSKNDSYVL